MVNYKLSIDQLPSKHAVIGTIITLDIYVVIELKTCFNFIQYLMNSREFAQWANTLDFVGPFTTSCEG